MPPKQSTTKVLKPISELKKEAEAVKAVKPVKVIEKKPKKKYTYIRGIPAKEYYQQRYQEKRGSMIERKRAEMESNKFLQKFFDNHALFLLYNPDLIDHINSECHFSGGAFSPPLKMLLQSYEQIKDRYVTRRNLEGEELEQDNIRINEKLKEMLVTGELKRYYVLNRDYRSDVPEVTFRSDEEEESDCNSDGEPCSENDE